MPVVATSTIAANATGRRETEAAPRGSRAPLTTRRPACRGGLEIGERRKPPAPFVQVGAHGVTSTSGDRRAEQVAQAPVRARQLGLREARRAAEREADVRVRESFDVVQPDDRAR